MELLIYVGLYLGIGFITLIGVLLLNKYGIIDYGIQDTEPYNVIVGCLVVWPMVVFIMTPLVLFADIMDEII